MYEETTTKTARIKTWYPGSTITSCQILEGTLLIFQVSRGTPVPPMTFVPKPRISVEKPPEVDNPLCGGGE
jgi:hypothetical protein